MMNRGAVLTGSLLLGALGFAYTSSDGRQTKGDLPVFEAAPSDPASSRIDETLQRVFAATAPDAVVSVLVFLKQPDVAGALDGPEGPVRGRALRHHAVVTTLRKAAETTQQNLREELEILQQAGLVQRYRPFWIANLVQVDAPEDVLLHLAQRPEVHRIYHNLTVEILQPIELPAEGAGEMVAGFPAGGTGGLPGAPEPGLIAVRAPDAWTLGYTGAGVLIATIDSGVDGNHPAIASRWRGLDPAYADNPEWAWFDPAWPEGGTSFPIDYHSGSHGTHVTGTIVGGEPGGTIGVAPGAQWIAAAGISGGGAKGPIADIIASFQWMADPTGTGDVSAVPHVCSNSWGTFDLFGHPPCDQTFWSWIDNSEKAGTAHFFAAGNEGQFGLPLRRPADRATSGYQSTAVGAVDASDVSMPGLWPLAIFSAQGPTQCTPDGSLAIKPEVVAPGLQVLSSVAGGGYAAYSGTSMASPHAAGVAALIYEACDLLTGDTVKQIIFDTAVDLGSPGKNNHYGWGMVDAKEAVLMALAQCTLGISLPEGPPTVVLPGAAAQFPVRIFEGMESLVPGTAKLHYRLNSEDEFVGVELTPLADEEYLATLPAAACADSVEFYLEAHGDQGTVVRLPLAAPAEVFTPLVGWFDVTEFFYSDFAKGLPAGWSMIGLWHLHTGDECTAHVSDCSPSAQYMYYGISPLGDIGDNTHACTYETGGANLGELLSAPIAFPEVRPGEKLTLSFCYNLETENDPDHDIARFSVLGTGFEQTLVDASNWTTFSVDATPWSGQTHALRWRFDSVDGLFNDFRGWQVDRVRIIITSEFQCEDPTVPADLDGNGVVNVFDLLILLTAWGECPPPTKDDCPADFDGNGVVNVFDLLFLLLNWG